jgi:hypothetical protein
LAHIDISWQGSLTNRALSHAHAVEHLGRAPLTGLVSKRFVEGLYIRQANKTVTNGTTTIEAPATNSPEAQKAEEEAQKQQEEAAKQAAEEAKKQLEEAQKQQEEAAKKAAEEAQKQQGKSSWLFKFTYGYC